MAIKLQLQASTNLLRQWNLEDRPTSESMHQALFVREAIEWNRIGACQTITLRLIADRLLNVNCGDTYLPQELISQYAPGKLFLPLAMADAHVYCSPHNEGALDLANSLNETFGSTIRSAQLLQTVATINECEHMLLYLTDRTWRSGGTSEQLAAHVSAAMEAGVHLLLAHEVPPPSLQPRPFQRRARRLRC